MSSYASATIVGHLGRDPAARQVGDKTVANFSIAVSSRRGGRENTTWFDVSAWGKLADVATSYLKKGSPVMVAGNLQMETYEKKDGGQGSKLALDARDIVLLGSKPAADNESSPASESIAPVAKAMQQAQAATAAKPAPPVGDDGPPF